MWGFANWDLLASMQAVAIYILFRLDEGETEQNDFDLLLLATVTVSLASILFLSYYPGCLIIFYRL